MTHTTMSAEDLRIEARQRQQIKDSDLIDLADSIKRVGLIHAPVVNDFSDRLIAGERRIKAMKIAEVFQYGNETYEYPDIPVHRIQRDDPKLLFEIELEENLRRVSLTPLEEAQAIASLHKIRYEENPFQTQKATAKEVASIKGERAKSTDERQVANSILVDQFKDDPEVQKAAKVSLQKAANVAKKKMEIEFLRALQGLEHGEEADPSSMFTLYPGDALEILPTLEAQSFDILLFDPPYGVGANKFGEQAMDLGHDYDDSWEKAKETTEGILTEAKHFLKPDAHILMFCAFEKWTIWRAYYEALEFSVWPRPLIWSKGQQSHVPVPDYGPRYSYECILFAGRGQRRINRLINDVLHIPGVRNKMHAAEKPAALLAELIDFLGKPGDRIIDPTVGSGSIFEGAKGKEVYVVGIEKDPNSYAIAKERMK